MKKRKLTLLLTALGLSGMLLAGCNFQGPNAAINSQAGTYEKQQLFQLYAAAGGTMTYDEWLASVRGADGSSLLADRRNPTDADGKNGDVFVNIETWDLFLKVGGSWTNIGNIKGAPGQDGKDGKDGVDGKDGKDGVDGKDGKDGAPGQDGAPGTDGVGIKEIKKTGNDGYSDIYTIYLTDDSEYDFKVPNPAVSLDVESYRIEFDDNWNVIDLPYYLGTTVPMDLLVYAQYADGSEMRVEDDEYTVTGFSTATEGTREATVKFGPVSETVEYRIINIVDEIAAGLASELSIDDALPAAFTSNPIDYSFSPSYRQLAIKVEEGKEDEFLAQYVADFLAAEYTEAGEDKYGDMHYTSKEGNLDVCVWDYPSEYAGRVFIDFKSTAVPEYTTDSALEAALAAIKTVISGNVTIKTDSSGEKYIAFSLGTSIANMKLYVEYYFVPDDFELGDWTDTASYSYANAVCGNIYLQYLVYPNPSNSSSTVIQVTAGTIQQKNTK